MHEHNIDGWEITCQGFCKKPPTLYWPFTEYINGKPFTTTWIIAKDFPEAISNFGELIKDLEIKYPVMVGDPESWDGLLAKIR